MAHVTMMIVENYAVVVFVCFICDDSRYLPEVRYVSSPSSSCAAFSDYNVD